MNDPEMLQRLEMVEDVAGGDIMDIIEKEEAKKIKKKIPLIDMNLFLKALGQTRDRPPSPQPGTSRQSPPPLDVGQWGRIIIPAADALTSVPQQVREDIDREREMRGEEERRREKRKDDLITQSTPPHPLKFKDKKSFVDKYIDHYMQQRESEEEEGEGDMLIPAHEMGIVRMFAEHMYDNRLKINLFHYVVPMEIKNRQSVYATDINVVEGGKVTSTSRRFGDELMLFRGGLIERRGEGEERPAFYMGSKTMRNRAVFNSIPEYVRTNVEAFVDSFIGENQCVGEMDPPPPSTAEKRTLVDNLICRGNYIFFFKLAAFLLSYRTEQE